MYEQFPSTRWVFPSARAKHFYWTQADRRQLAQNNKDNTTEWFELASLEKVQLESPEQLTTLQASATYILRIIDDEIGHIKSVGGGSQKIFIGGVGQGAALALVVLLCLHHQLGVYVGMDGWMPCAETLSSLLNQNQIGAAGCFFKSSFIAAQQNRQQARTADPSPSGTQFGEQPAEILASKVVVPEHVKSMVVCLSRSQLGKAGLVDNAVSILNGIGFYPIFWNLDPEHIGKEEEARGHDNTVVFPATPEQVEKLVNFFKNLNLAG